MSNENSKKLLAALKKSIDPKSEKPLRGAPESGAFKRLGVALKGIFKPKLSLARTPETAWGEDILFTSISQSKKGIKLQGIEYLEFPNSTALKIKNPKTLKWDTYLLTRGIRNYQNRISRSGASYPKEYISDVLLFKQRGNSLRFEFIKRLITSDPTRRFIFEDPRISLVYEKPELPRIFLSGTEYSPHVQGSTEPDVMNRYVELHLDSKGIPSLDKLEFKNLSPFPRQNAGMLVTVDAKNGTIAENEDGMIVVRTRLRPEFKLWKYGEQVFIFKSLVDLESYDWGKAVHDLFNSPDRAKILLKDSQLRELYSDKRVIREKGKGVGPGTRPVRFRRDGTFLYFSDGKNAPEIFAGKILNPAQFAIPDGEVKYLTFDHEIRFMKRTGFVKRHYSMTAKLFDRTLTKIEAYYADLIQPKDKFEKGFHAGISDLEHVYPMGVYWNLVAKKFVLDVVAGASDAHTTIYRFDPMKLFAEMAPGSKRWKTGQIYRNF